MHRGKTYLQFLLIIEIQWFVPRLILNEIYNFNPLLFDFVTKRIIKTPQGNTFPRAVFMKHPKLNIYGDDDGGYMAGEKEEHGEKEEGKGKEKEKSGEPEVAGEKETTSEEEKPFDAHQAQDTTIQQDI